MTVMGQRRSPGLTIAPAPGVRRTGRGGCSEVCHCAEQAARAAAADNATADNATACAAATDNAAASSGEGDPAAEAPAAGDAVDSAPGPLARLSQRGRSELTKAGAHILPERLTIAGLVPLSTCDWPGHLVATVFLQGCPWQCTYCHNPDLMDPRADGQVEWQAVRDLLAKRHGLLDGVVFSGGEPTRQAALLAAVIEVRDAGYQVGLHTGGSFPRRLEQLLPYVDWVGLDIKATPAKYDAITQRTGGAALAFESLQLVLDAGVAVQVRTTVDPTILTDDDVTALAAELRSLGVTEHVLQEVRPNGTTPEYQAALAAVRSAG